MDQSYSAYDILGIDYDQIPAIQSAIEDYIKKVEDITTNISADAGQIDYLKGIQGGEQVEALKGYLNDAVDKIHIVTKNLRNFKDALEQVKSNYEAQQGNIAGEMGKVSETATEIKTGVVGFDD